MCRADAFFPLLPPLACAWIRRPSRPPPRQFVQAVPWLSAAGHRLSLSWVAPSIGCAVGVGRLFSSSRSGSYLGSILRGASSNLPPLQERSALATRYRVTSRGTPRRRGGAPAEQYVGHLLELFCIVPLAVCGMNAAEKQITDVEAIDGPDQRFEIDVLPQCAVGLELSNGREHWVPEMPAPEAREVIAQLGVARKFAEQSPRDWRIGVEACEALGNEHRTFPAGRRRAVEQRPERSPFARQDGA